MNLFLLSLDPDQCAKWHCDKHVVKMILETVQMLYSAWHVNGVLPSDAPLCKSTGNPGYKLAHKNHPITKWMRASAGNYDFAVRLGAALCVEFEWRYGHYHECTKHVIWLAHHRPPFDSQPMTPMPQAMPDEYKVEGDSVQAYRNYYIGDKVRFAKWSKRPQPPWWLHG